MKNREISYKIEETIAVIGKGTQGWQRELNIVTWGENSPKFDIRDWNADHTAMGKGLTFDITGLRRLYTVLKDVFSEEGEGDGEGEGGEGGQPKDEQPKDEGKDEQPKDEQGEKPKKSKKSKKQPEQQPQPQPQPQPDDEEGPRGDEKGEWVPAPAGEDTKKYEAARLEYFKQHMEGREYKLIAASTKEDHAEIVYYDDKTKRYAMARVFGTPGDFSIVE